MVAALVSWKKIDMAGDRLVAAATEYENQVNRHFQVVGNSCELLQNQVDATVPPATAGTCPFFRHLVPDFLTVGTQ